MDAFWENERQRERILSLLQQICFRKKRIKKLPLPGYSKRQGDDSYALAVIYRKEAQFARAEKAGLASVRYFEEVLAAGESVDALWDLGWSWILLRDLYRGQTSPSYREKALDAALKCVRLFLRMTRLSNGGVYFKNYQICCTIAVNIMLDMGGEYIPQADDLCKECLKELRRWPNPASDPVAYCRIGSIWFLRLSVYGAMQKHSAFDAAAWKKKRLRAIRQGTLLYQKAMDTDPENADVASFVVDDYAVQRRNEALSDNLRSYYTQKEYGCYELMFLQKPKENARNFFCIAMLYCNRSADLFPEAEKAPFFAGMARHMKFVDFCAAHDANVPYYQLKAAYYLAQVHKACFPYRRTERTRLLARCCLLGEPILTSGKYDHDTGGFYLLALDDLLEEDEMPAQSREAFTEKMQKVLNVIEEEDDAYGRVARRLNEKLNTVINGNRDLSNMSYFDFDEEDD